MITLIVGDIPFLQSQALAQIRQEEADCDPEIFHGPEAKARQIMEAVTTLSLLSARPAAIVRAADRLPKREQDHLLQGLSAIPDSAHLILVADKIDRRLKFWQVVQKAATLISAEAPSKDQVRPWFIKEGKRRGLEWQRDALELVVECAVTDFNQAVMLLDKIQLYQEEDAPVTAEVVETCHVGASPQNIFAWSDAVAARDWRASLRILQGLWQNHEEPLVLLGLLVRHFRILLKAVESRQQWGQRQAMAARLGVPPFAVARYCSQAKLYTRQDLLQIWQELFQTNRELKSSPVKRELVLEDLMWRLKSRGGSPCPPAN